MSCSSSNMSNLKYIYVNIKMCLDINGNLKGRKLVFLLCFLFLYLIWLGFLDWASAPKAWPPAPLCLGTIHLHAALHGCFHLFLSSSKSAWAFLLIPCILRLLMSLASCHWFFTWLCLQEVYSQALQILTETSTTSMLEACPNSRLQVHTPPGFAQLTPPERIGRLKLKPQSAHIKRDNKLLCF